MTILLSLLGLLWLLLCAAGVVVAVGVGVLVWVLGHPPRTGLARALAKGGPTDPGELLGGELEYEEVTLPLSCPGKVTPAWVIEGRDADGPTVVVLHAFGESRYSLLREVPTLVGSASRVVLADGRGQGDSSPGRNDGGRHEQADVMAMVDALGPRDGSCSAAERSGASARLAAERSGASSAGDGDAGPRPERVVLVGESFGAFVSLLTAAKYPERVLAVVAVSAYSRWDAPIGCLLKSLRVPRWPFVPLTLLVMRVFHGPIPTVLPLAERVRCPVMLVHGVDDPLTTLAGAEELMAALPNASMIRLPTRDHTGLLAHLAPEVIHEWLMGVDRREMNAAKAGPEKGLPAAAASHGEDRRDASRGGVTRTFTSRYPRGSAASSALPEAAV